MLFTGGGQYIRNLCMLTERIMGPPYTWARQPDTNDRIVVVVRAEVDAAIGGRLWSEWVSPRNQDDSFDDARGDSFVDAQGNSRMGHVGEELCRSLVFSAFCRTCIAENGFFPGIPSL